jgi:hypothetical protein
MNRETFKCGEQTFIPAFATFFLLYHSVTVLQGFLLIDNIQSLQAFGFAYPFFPADGNAGRFGRVLNAVKRSLFI